MNLKILYFEPSFNFKIIYECLQETKYCKVWANILGHIIKALENICVILQSLFMQLHCTMYMIAKSYQWMLESTPP